MNDLWTTFSTAIAQLLSGDPELWGIVGVSFSVSASALLIALLPALSAGFTLAYFRFPGRWVAISLLNSLLAVPTVVVGLVLYMLLSRAGPLGDLNLLFMQRAGAELDDTSTAVFARSSLVRGETFSQDGFSFTPSATFFPLLNSAASTALMAAISMSSLDS